MEPEVRERFERIEAILEVLSRQHQAAMARMDRADARMDRADARMDRADAHFEKRMRGFEKLAMIGMKELANLSRTQKSMKATLDAFVKSMRGGNGRGNGRPR